MRDSPVNSAVAENPKKSDSPGDRRWRYGFAGLVRVSWISPDGVDEIQYGSGVLVTRTLIITAKHVVHNGGKKATPRDFVVRQDLSNSTVACERIERHADLDLALLWLSEELPAPNIVWLNGGVPFDCLPEGVFWRAFGYPAESGKARACQQVLSDPHPSPGSDASGSLVRIQIEKGLPYGYSGGPVFLESGTQRMFVGIGRLGGDGASVTGVLPSDEILKFLEEHEKAVRQHMRTESAAHFFAAAHRRHLTKVSIAIAGVGLILIAVLLSTARLGAPRPQQVTNSVIESPDIPVVTKPESRWTNVFGP